MITVYHLEHDKINREKSISVFFKADEMFDDVKSWLKNDGYTKVAEIQSENLERAFELTNHIDYPWDENTSGEVKCLKEPGKARSTSVGDVMERDGKYFLVTAIGFVRLTM